MKTLLKVLASFWSLALGTYLSTVSFMLFPGAIAVIMGFTVVIVMAFLWGSLMWKMWKVQLTWLMWKELDI